MKENSTSDCGWLDAEVLRVGKILENQLKTKYARDEENDIFYFALLDDLQKGKHTQK